MSAPHATGLHAALASRLDELAGSGATITYGALARDMGLRLASLTEALERLMEEDHAKGQPFRAVLCEAKLGNGLPARGFFEKAASLGRDISDPVAFTQSERELLFTRAATDR